MFDGEFKITDEQFKEAEQSFDAVFRNMIKKMLKRDAEEGVASLRLKVSFFKREDDFGVLRTVPKFEYDTTSEIKERVKINGKIEPESFIDTDDERDIVRLVPLPERQQKMNI